MVISRLATYTHTHTHSADATLLRSSLVRRPLYNFRRYNETLQIYLIVCGCQPMQTMDTFAWVSVRIPCVVLHLCCFLPLSVSPCHCKCLAFARIPKTFWAIFSLMSEEDEDKHKTSTGKSLLISKKLRKKQKQNRKRYAERRRTVRFKWTQLEWARSLLNIWHCKLKWFRFI